jgi:hypothetical protein
MKKLSNSLRAVAGRMKESYSNELINFLESESKIDASGHNTYKGFRGSREEPPEPAEVEVTDASISEFPTLDVDWAEELPRHFKMSVSGQVTDEYENEYDIVCHFEITVKNKKLLPNGEVEIDFEEKFKGWDYE